MSPSDFIIWLGGFVDALGGATPTPAQWATINGKLDSVFNKVTPDRTITVTRTLDTSAQGYTAPYQFITTGMPAGQLRGYGDADSVERFSITHTC